MKPNKIYYLLTIVMLAILISSCGENYIDALQINQSDKNLKEDIDSVSSWNHYTFSYNDDVIVLSEEQQAYLTTENKYILPEQEYILFRSNTPDDVIPEVGKIMLIPTGSSIAPCGFSGRVAFISDDQYGKRVYCYNVNNQEVFKTLDMDIRLNAEQISELNVLSYTENEELVEYIDDSAFFENAPNCAMQYEIDNAVDTTPSYLLRKEKSDSDKEIDTKPKVEISLVKIAGGMRCILKVDAQKDKNGKDLPIKATVVGYIDIHPLYFNPKAFIDEYGDYVETIEEATTFKINISETLAAELKTLKNHNICIKTPTFKFDCPVGPTVVTIRDMLEFGILGKIETGFGFSNEFTEEIYTEYRNYELVKKVSKSDFDLFKNTKFNFDKFKFEGGIYIKNYFGFTPKIYKGSAFVEQKLTLTAKAVLPNPDLFREEPKAYVDLDTKFRLCTFEKDEWYKPSGLLNFSIGAQKLSWELYIFPHCNDLIGLRYPNDTKAEITYNTDPWYLLWLASHKFEMDIVSEDWLKEKNNAYVQGTYQPDLIGQSTSNYAYKINVNGLNPNKRYYGVPVYTLWGLRMHGNPFPLDNARKMLGIIGPATTLGHEFIRFKYNPYGLITTIDNRFDESKTYLEWEDNKPISIKIVDYSYDENGIYVPSDVSYIRNLKNDEKTGVLTSCRWYEDGDFGNVRLYYDEQYHITGITDHATDGSTTTSFKWDKDGRIISISVNDEDSHTQFNYDYSGNAIENKMGQWTYGTGMPLSFLSFPHLAGRAPVYLPTGLTIIDTYKDTTETEHMNFKYEFNKDGSIESESIKGSEGGWAKLPYGYRMVGASEEVTERNEFLGSSRCSENSASGQSNMRKIRTFGKKHK